MDLSNSNPSIINEPNRVVFSGEDAEAVVYGSLPYDEEVRAEFEALFELDKSDYLRNTDFYQGVKMTRVIRRRSDGKLFGYEYDEAPGIDSFDQHLTPESNGDEHGFAPELNEDFECVTGPFYVFLPVREITIKGFELA